MRMVDIINKKREGNALTREEIRFFVNGYVKGELPDYQISALLMAIVFVGMNTDEIHYLTGAMMRSGDIVDLSQIDGIKVDKHSTGGVGDTTSLVLGPMVAACGVKVAKMSGRGLGHTGGTLDKLESIPGLSVSKTTEEFIKQVNDIGIAIIGQTSSLVPADKKLYALRDVTGTVESIPLIASSVMSKKIASGSDVIVLEVTVGDGAFMKDMASARKLAEIMVRIGRHFKKKVTAVITSMDEPLGYAIGNFLEIKEAIDCLKGHGPKDLMELCYTCGAILLVGANKAKDIAEARKKLEEVITNGEAFEKFKQMVKAQGGDENIIMHPETVSKPIYEHKILSSSDGFIHQVKAYDMGIISMKIGGGRETKEDSIDPYAGIILNKKVGEQIKKGDLLATIYTNKVITDDLLEETLKCFVINESPCEVSEVIKEIID